jgi:hypothetical protein
LSYFILHFFQEKQSNTKGGKEILEDERDFSDSHFTRLAPCDRPEKKNRSVLFYFFFSSSVKYIFGEYPG